MLRDGSPRPETKVVTLDGKRYNVITRDDQVTGIGPRAWTEQIVTSQDVEPQETAMRLLSFHEGSGFSYDGMPNTYAYANGWDAATPGKIRTWAPLATAATATLATALPAGARGWLHYDEVNGYLYMLRGRYISKYAVDFSSASWAKSHSDIDLTSTYVVGGRPALFDGKLYVPKATQAAMASAVFYELTMNGASADSSANGPAGKEARAFHPWKNLLARGSVNTIETCATTPTTDSNWAGSLEVSNSSDQIIDLATYDQNLYVRTARGLWSIDPNLKPINELPDLRSVPDIEGTANTVSNGNLILNHTAGLIRWQPQSYVFIGPEREGALEGDIDEGWGRCADIVSYGRQFFATVNNPATGTGALLSFSPARGDRGPLVPHCHRIITGSYEGLCIINNGTTDTRTALAVIAVSPNGLTATPTMYELPRAALNAADDPNVDHATSSVQFWTSRLTAPARSLQKVYRTVEWYQESSPTTNTPGFQWWASIDGGTFVQLNDSTGVTGEWENVGFNQAFFPTTANVGAYMQLKGVVPALGGGEDPIDVTIRDVTVRASVRPLSSSIIQAHLILDGGEGVDRGQDARTIKKQEDDLRALRARGAGSGAIAYHDTDGRSGYAELRELTFTEGYWRQEQRPVKIARAVIEVRSYA